MYTKDELQNQLEIQKQQIIHSETIAMMTKYQLVFLKMETLWSKSILTVKMKYVQQKLWAFSRLKQLGEQKQKQKQIIAQRLVQQLNQVSKILNRQKKYQLTFSLTKLKLAPKPKNDKIRKSFLQVIASKDNEIKNLQIKENEMIESLTIQRQKEQEIQNKIKQKDIYIQQLELEIKKNSGGYPRTLDQKVLNPNSQKMRSLEVENQEMQDRIMSTEDSVSMFIREMNELLDSHEISTNLDSDENGSYEQPHIEYQSQRQNPLPRQSKPKNFYSNQLTRSTKIN
ncbi:hypothetical protein pb186bvf_012981 [Paramecium bursaria]